MYIYSLIILLILTPLLYSEKLYSLFSQPSFVLITRRNLSPVVPNRPLNDDPFQFIVSFTAAFKKSFSVGLGLFYSRYATNASPNINVYALSIGTQSVNKKNIKKFTVNNFGPLIGITSNPENGSLVFVAEIRPGFVFFFDDASYSEITENFYLPTLGIGTVLGMEYLINKHIGIGMTLNGLYTSKYTTSEKRIGVMDFGFEIKYHITALSTTNVRVP